MSMATSLAFTQMSRKLQKEIEVSVQETYPGIEHDVSQHLRRETVIHTSKFMNFQLRSPLPFSCPHTNFLFFYKFFLFSISFFISKQFKN